jgi:U4/U6.U5 tri-snRNP-associated protein 3
MKLLMGFSGFESTKGQKVAGTDVSASDVRKKKRKFRQFLKLGNRGGFKE